jgi:hypothetical protein
MENPARPPIHRFGHGSLLLGILRNEAAGTRTQDLRIKSPLLYQLSYNLKSLFSRRSCNLGRLAVSW